MYIVFSLNMYACIYVIVPNLGAKFRIATFTLMKYLGDHFNFRITRTIKIQLVLLCQNKLNYWQTNSNAY